MPVTPEPILDVVRGLSTIASFAIVVQQVKNIFDAFFVGECSRCRGTGLLTCPHCHGTKTLRRRPGYLRTRDMGVVDDARDQYPCGYCGPVLTYDFNPFAEDEEIRALEIQDNLKSAVANRFPRPFDARPTAGTITCPSCHGSPHLKRLTPDFARALDLGPAWDEVVASRMGRWYWGRESRPADKQKLYLEYPSEPVRSPIEMPSPQPLSEAERQRRKEEEEERRREEKARSGATIVASRRNGLEDYVLTFVSDDED